MRNDAQMWVWLIYSEGIPKISSAHNKMSKAMDKKPKLERRSSKIDDIKSKQLSLSETIVAVFSECKTGEKALQALELAIDKSSKIEQIPIEKLDFGDLKALDKFYSAPVVVVDVSERRYEASLYYQIGLRESFGMKHNVVTCLDADSSYIGGRRAALASDQAVTSNAAVRNKAVWVDGVRVSLQRLILFENNECSQVQ